MTISKAMNISLTGLNANQAALNVVSHNIANINTEGYVRQRANFAEMRTATTDGTVSGQIASLAGVRIASITTATNDYLNNYYRTQNSKLQGLLSEADTAGQIADLMDELKGTGLGDALDDFFSTANSLNQNPTDYSLRVNYAQKAKNVANKFNAMSSNITKLRESKIGNGQTIESAESSEAGTYVNQLNSYVEQLLGVNKQILTNKDDAGLKTQRDQLLSQISSLANVTTSINSSGTANVSIGDIDLIKHCEIQTDLKITANGRIVADNATGNTVDITDSITEGSLGGTLNSLSTFDDAMNDINALAKAFAEKMNELQTKDNGTGTPCSYNRTTDQLEKSTENLFNIGDGSTDFTAGNITINDAILQNPDLIAAARVDTNVTGWEKSVGNGDNALEMYNVQNEKLGALGGLTLNDYIISLGTKFALEAAQKTNDAEIQGGIVDGINDQILSETGVNLDEELSNMIIYQQAYNASARVFSACVEVFDTLVNLGT